MAHENDPHDDNYLEAAVTANLEQHLAAWTRELLACVTIRERAAFVMRESGMMFPEVAARLGVGVERTRQLWAAATEKMTGAARRGVLLTNHVPAVEQHVPPRPPPHACTAEQCVVPDSMRRALDLPVMALAVGVRGVNGMESENIRFVGDLVQRHEAELLRVRGIGRKTTREIKEALSAIGLHLAMDVGGWRPHSG